MALEREGGVGVDAGFFVVGDVELTVDGACVVLRCGWLSATVPCTLMSQIFVICIRWGVVFSNTLYTTRSLRDR